MKFFANFKERFEFTYYRKVNQFASLFKDNSHQFYKQHPELVKAIKKQMKEEKKAMQHQQNQRKNIM